MISSNPNKCLSLVFFALVFCASCSFWQNTDGKSKVEDSESSIQTNIPFSTKEPDIFQAEVVVTTYANKEESERKMFIAKKNEKLLVTFGIGTNEKFSYLVRSDDEIFVVDHSGKSIKKRRSSDKGDRASSSDDWQKFLTTKWLNEKTSTSFEKLEDENGLMKYRVDLGDTKNSEVLVFVEKKQKIPVKQEFYSVSGGKKTLTYKVEVKDLKTEVADSLFDLPEDYK